MKQDEIGELWGNTCMGDEGLGKWKAPKAVARAVTKTVAKPANFVKTAGVGRTFRAAASLGLSETKVGKKVVSAGTKVAKAVGLDKVEKMLMAAMNWFKRQIDQVVAKLKGKAFNSIVANVRKSVGLGEFGEDLGYLGEDVDTQKMDKFIVDRTKDYMISKTPEMAVTTASTVATAQIGVGTAAASTAGVGAAPAAAAAVPTATATLTAYFGNLAKDGAVKVGKQVADAKTGGKFSKVEKMYDTGGNLYQKIDSGKTPSVSDIKAPSFDSGSIQREAEKRLAREAEQKRRDAEERARREAEQKRRDIEERAQREAEQKRREAEERAQREASELQAKILKDAENKAKASIVAAIVPKQPRTDTVVAPVVENKAKETVVSLQQKDVVAVSNNESKLVSSSSIVSDATVFKSDADDSFAPAKKK